MRRAFSAIVGGAVALSANAQAQQKVPVIELTPVSAKSSETLGAILGLKQLPSGQVLVNDAGRRQIRLFDENLSRSKIIIDSTQGVSNTYGPYAAPLIPWLADSTLFVDLTGNALVVFDPKGQVARTMAPPGTRMLGSLINGAANIDNKGRMLYVGPTVITRNQNTAPLPGAPMMGGPITPPDSAPVLRADFDTRGVDTIGKIKRQSGGKMSMNQDDKGNMKVKMTINPVSIIDEWAVLADGSVAFIRGHDYHIDWIHPDGSTSSSAKLPFDWKRLTDADKQALIDSARTAQEKAIAAGKSANPADKKGQAEAEMGAMKAMAGGGGGMVMEVRVSDGGGRGGGGGAPIMNGDGGGRSMTAFSATPELDFVPLTEIADYYPAIRQGAAKADLDGNLWILPTTSAQSKNGELVYDVVNNKGDLFERVRLPAGRALVGFGKGGILYLTSGDKATGFFLERARLIGGLKSTTQ